MRQRFISLFRERHKKSKEPDRERRTDRASENNDSSLLKREKRFWRRSKVEKARVQRVGSSIISKVSAFRREGKDRAVLREEKISGFPAE
jgi:hypothetical protein